MGDNRGMTGNRLSALPALFMATLLSTPLKALRKAGINIVVIHNHMTHGEPKFVFLHYWGKGPAAGLAKGLKSALDTQGR
jgi:hypothetical protein